MAARRLTLLAGLVVTIMVFATAFAMVPSSDFGGAAYEVRLDYSTLTEEAWQAPGIGMGDFLYRGSSHADLEYIGNYLVVHGSYIGLAGAILPEVETGIHVHHDPALDDLGTLVGSLAHTGGVSGTFEGAVYLTPEQQTMLVEGRLFLDIHTTAFPEGEMRGWVVPSEVAGPTTASR